MAAAKELAAAARWQLVENEHDLGFVRFGVPALSGSKPLTLLVDLAAQPE